MDDTIYRQAAIDLWEKYHPTIAVDAMQYDAELRQLPPIQPVNNSENPNSSDVISRQQAIDGLRDYLVGKRCPDDGTLTCRLIENEVINKLPIIQPKRGKWLYCEDSMADSVDGYRCDQCGFFVPWDYQHKGIDFIQDYNFCPNCGADMREVTE